MGNGAHGIDVQQGISTIGGTTGLTAGACTGSCNAIRFNGGAGVSGAGAVARANGISDNAGLGIDGGGAGVTPNDPNDVTAPQNFPVITVVTFDSGSGTSTVQGTLHSAPSQAYTIDVFDNGSADPSGHGEGEVYFGSGTCMTNAGGDGFWTVVATGMLMNPSATATRAGSSGRTSEFSAVWVDSDGDSHGDGVDCAPADPTAFAPPPEVPGLTFSNPDTETITWTSVAAQSGAGTVYDVLGIDVAALPVDGGAGESCIEASVGSNWTTVTAVPDPGQALGLLVHGRNVCGAGTFGFASDGAERVSSVCP
jgi:hypothetical protein